MRKKDEVETCGTEAVRPPVLRAGGVGERTQVQEGPDSCGRRKPLARARVKISSGCFTSCDVACDLDHIEALLVSAASTACGECTDSVDGHARAVHVGYGGSGRAGKQDRVPRRQDVLQPAELRRRVQLRGGRPAGTLTGIGVRKENRGPPLEGRPRFRFQAWWALQDLNL